MAKTLWLTDFPSNTISTPTALVDLATTIGVTNIALRTTSIHFSDLIPPCNNADINVIAWRWPAVSQSWQNQEISRVRTLVAIGLAGYIADPEGQSSSPGIDWNQSGLESLAANFCAGIKEALAGKPFGVTSHFRPIPVFPKLPWSEFIAASDLVFPQSYWRVDTNHGPAPVLNGDPVENYDLGITEWERVGATAGSIIPMAGEIAVVTANEIQKYGVAAAAKGITDLHFYSGDVPVPQSVWNAIAALPS